MARLPAQGEIVHALETWQEPAGGGGVAAVQLARLAGRCDFLTACDARTADGLRERGVAVHAAERPTRRAITFVDGDGERTITLLDPRVVPSGADDLPWELLSECAAVYLTGGDAGVARAAREAAVLVATPRAHDALDGIEVDVLVGSGNDADEVAWAEGIAARHVVWTAGGSGGRWAGVSEGTWAAAEVPGEVADSYGCGDSFAAGLTFALGRGEDLADALAFGARCGASCLAGKGPYGSTLPAP